MTTPVLFKQDNYYKHIKNIDVCIKVNKINYVSNNAVSLNVKWFRTVNSHLVKDLGEKEQEILIPLDVQEDWRLLSNVGGPDGAEYAI